MPMGEAWFMGTQRYYYTTLMEQPVANIPVQDLQRVLEEIASGTKAFGHLVEWDQWFRYLLPDLIERAHERYIDPLLELLITAFFQVFWSEIPEEYQGFRSDVLNTLPRALFRLRRWHWELDPSEELQHAIWAVRGIGIWSLPKGAFSATMFWALQFLRPEEMTEWVASLVAAPSHRWRITLLSWLDNTQELLQQPTVPATKIRGMQFLIDWDWCWVLGGLAAGDRSFAPGHGFNEEADFLPHSTRAAFLEQMAVHLPVERYFEWMEPFLSDEAEDIPTKVFFEELFDKRYAGS
jgi:hypothetical protein